MIIFPIGADRHDETNIQVRIAEEVDKYRDNVNIFSRLLDHLIGNMIFFLYTV